MNFLTNLNLNKNELQNVVIQNLAVAPENPKEGQIYYDTKAKQYYGFRNGQWKVLGADLPTINVGTVEGLQAALDKKADKEFEHTHANKAALDSISDQKIANWDDANSKKHTHNNKSVLDGITSQKVTNWDNSLGNAKSYTDQKIADLIGGAPEALNTLKELGDALTSHEGEYNALLTVVGGKAEKSYVDAQLANKASIEQLESGLNLKANLAYVDEQLALKSDKTHKHNWAEIQNKPSMFAPRKFTQDFGATNTTRYTITHNLGTADVTVTLVDKVTNQVVFADVTFSNTNQLVIDMGAAPLQANAYKVVVVG